MKVSHHEKEKGTSNEHIVVVLMDVSEGTGTSFRDCRGMEPV
jgi:hypothetical protein